MLQKVVRLPRIYKQVIMMASDAVILPFAFWASIALRLSDWSPDIPNLLLISLILPAVAIPIFIRLGLYRAVIRYMDDRLFFTAFYGVSLTVLVLGLVVLMLGLSGIPRSSFVIFWLLSTILVAASRVFARKVLQQSESLSQKDRRQKIAIYGAGRAGIQLAMAFASSPEYRVLAFFDDSSDLQGTTVCGVRVYSPKVAAKISEKLDLKEIILALPTSSRSRRKEIIQQLEPLNLNLKILPGMADLVGGKVRVEDLRDVGIEDLLGRDQIPPDEKLLGQVILGANVLVTGAGGSIGSELCRQIIIRNPKRLVLYEISEYGLYTIERELRELNPTVEIIPVLADTQDFGRILKALRDLEVGVVYHAAAYKHVPLVEENICSGVANNVLGTLSVASAATLANVERFVLVSTDKAVRPTNVMGASKRFAELILQALDHQLRKLGPDDLNPDEKKDELQKLLLGLIDDKQLQRVDHNEFSPNRGAAAGNASHSKRQIVFCMVRFGNVLGSSGSVVPLFKEQIRRGGPVTVTHPEVTRYFMTIPEASQLVLQAGAMAEGGEVFVLDMGESVKIFNLAERMIQLSGLTVRNNENPEGDIEIRVTGLRAGEKLYEELLIGNNVSQTGHPRILKAKEGFIEWTKLRPALAEVEKAVRAKNDLWAAQLIKQWVIEFTPTNPKLSGDLSTSNNERTQH